jgi:putative toxin-antitoxin system antitoxin component (TIGR02293 family)
MDIHAHSKKTKKRAVSLKQGAGSKITAVLSQSEGLASENKWLEESRTDVTKHLNVYVSRNKPKSEGKAFAIHKAIMDGIDFSVAEILKKELNFNDKEIADLLGTSESTFLRWRKSNRELDNNASDRLVRFARILEISTEVFDDKLKAWSWLKRPQFGLGGKIPLELMKSETGAREVEALLMRIEHGILA